MGTRKDATKEQLAFSLKEQMRRNSFEKITIKMIADGAGVIRPTFYNHFHDKYELLEYIFKSQIVDCIYPYMSEGNEKEAIGVGFRLIAQEWDFYRKAFQVIGQNSFNSIVAKTLRNMLYQLLEERRLRFIPSSEHTAGRTAVVPNEEGKRIERDLETILVVNYYAVSLANVLDTWVAQGEYRVEPEQLQEVYYYLVTHSFMDILETRR